MTTRPNVILIMCDDLGYGDTGFNGHARIQTPHLDAMRRKGANLTRFYAGGPVCSPTRGTCLTGRHYSRYGINHANVGHLPFQEVTLAQVAKEQGYATGHFGKWHLGTLDPAYSAKPNRHPEKNFAPPWMHDYDRSVATEFAVPTWDPSRDYHMRDYSRSDEPWHSPYYIDGQRVSEPILGCDSAYTMDHAIDFIRQRQAQPFFASIWFHAPHTPVEAGPAYHALYADDCSDEEAHYYGCVTAMDEQIGKLYAALEALDLGERTIVFFCSDNGPEGGEDLSRNRRSRGQTAGLRGRKRSLYNGGIAVPALVTWPGVVRSDSTISVPCSTLDYFPTLVPVMGGSLPGDRPIDGIDITDIVSGRQDRRAAAIPYRFKEAKRKMFDAPTLALIDDEWKLLTNLLDDGADQLYHCVDDPAERRDLLADHPERAQAMRRHLLDFMASCRESHHGADYPEPHTPVQAFQEPDGWRPER